MKEHIVFQDREDAGRQLAQKLKIRHFKNPLILAIPRGGVVIGAILAKELNAELDVVLSRKLRAPFQPELAIGAISEGGRVFLNSYADDVLESAEGYLSQEREHQLAEIGRRQKMIRSIRPQASVAGRTVIVTDDGIATGSTMIAALQTVRSHGPRELIVAVPVSSPERLHDVKEWCDETICLETYENFVAIGQFYVDFSAVEDEHMLKVLRELNTPPIMDVATETVRF